MVEKISVHTAYEKTTGEKHIFELYKKDEGAPYYVSLDGAFAATAESRKEAVDEILDTIRWYGWIRENPNFA